MNPVDLERHVDRALKALPEPRAPQALLPAIMAAARAAARRPWYARPWATWPGQWQAASAAVALLLVAGFFVLAPVVLPQLGWPDAFHATMRPVSEVFSRLDLFATAIEILGRTFWQSIAGVAVVLVVIMLATTVAIGAAIGRVALGGAHQS